MHEDGYREVRAASTCSYWIVPGYYSRPSDNSITRVIFAVFLVYRVGGRVYLPWDSYELEYSRYGSDRITACLVLAFVSHTHPRASSPPPPPPPINTILIIRKINPNDGCDQQERNFNSDVDRVVSFPRTCRRKFQVFPIRRFLMGPE
ncbi:hypothetical protein RUM44_009445 [Polyplax serrata]|uniref:Uncharacterized protein n=1 Tax=Polyplax serrata TaxID=468196 RepID=A0ABR1ASP9_POLSC